MSNFVFYDDYHMASEKCSDIRDMFVHYDLQGPILAYGFLGLWDGVKFGYKIIPPIAKGKPKLSDLFMVLEDYNTLYLDAYNLCGDCAHHDGTNRLKFRKLKADVNPYTFEELCVKHLSTHSSFTSAFLSKYTESLRDDVLAALGEQPD